MRSRKNFPPSARLELEARRGAGFLEEAPPRPEDDALVGVAVDDDRRADDGQALRRLAAQLLDEDAEAVRDLLARALEELLADRLGDPGRVVGRRDDPGRKERVRLGKVTPQRREEEVEPVARERRDGDDLFEDARSRRERRGAEAASPCARRDRPCSGRRSAAPAPPSGARGRSGLPRPVGTATSTTSRRTSSSRRASCASATMALFSRWSGLWRPGVSTKTICPSSSFRIPRRLRRVVCGLSDTIATFVPTSAFTSVDLPAFGRPTTATVPAAARRSAHGSAVVAAAEPPRGARGRGGSAGGRPPRP